MDNNRHLISSEELQLIYSEKSRYIRLAIGYIQNEKEAEDIFQNCVLSVLSNMDKLQVSDVRTYFSSMVRYSCYRYLELKKRTVSIEAERTRKFLQDHIEVLSSAKGDDSEDVFRRVDFQELLMKCQSMLPELTYDIFETKRIEKMSYRQISKAFGISESRINFEMTKALKVFRKVFKDYGLFTVMLVCLFR